MSAISADYRTNKHIPSRKCYQLILEVAEEEFPNVCQILGYPKTGENTYVAIALLQESTGHNLPLVEKSEGEKLRTKAVLLCKEDDFQQFSYELFPKFYDNSEYNATSIIYYHCNIKSRSELATNIDAQIKFKQLLEQYKTWQLEQRYSDNLERV